MDVLKVCPMLVPQNSSRTVYDGFINVSGRNFQLRIDLRAPDSVQGLKLHCDWELRRLLVGYQHLLQQRLQHCSNLAAFLVELKSILERRLDTRQHKQQQPPPPVFYADILQQIESLGWHRLTYVDPTFKQLHLVASDSRDREHTLRIRLHEQHPDQQPECSTDLPQHFDYVWTKKSTLLDLYRQFVQKLEQFQDFWDMLDEIDASTWILEPEKPTRMATYRRIALGNNASLQIELDVSHPRMLPECRFLGADHVVNPLKENLNKNLDKWNQQSSLLCNLQSVLGVELPSPASTNREDFSMECGVCYTYRLDGQIPDQVCDDKRCSQPFHTACLYEWLRSLPSSKTSFNLIFGECPYCSKRITVKMTTR